jgi:hypothetical protein
MSSHIIPQEKQQAIIIQRPGYASLVSDRPIPKLRDSYIVVKTAAVRCGHQSYTVTDWYPLRVPVLFVKRVPVKSKTYWYPILTSLGTL